MKNTQKKETVVCVCLKKTMKGIKSRFAMLDMAVNMTDVQRRTLLSWMILILSGEECDDHIPVSIFVCTILNQVLLDVR